MECVVECVGRSVWWSVWWSVLVGVCGGVFECVAFGLYYSVLCQFSDYVRLGKCAIFCDDIVCCTCG